MAKHYYQIDLVLPEPLDEDQWEDLEDALLTMTGARRVVIEYVDSEG